MYKVKNIKSPKKSKSIPLPEKINYSNKEIYIDFKHFEFKPIKIEGRFNNYFKDDEHYKSIVSTLLTVTLKSICNQDIDTLIGDYSLNRTLRFHKIKEGKYELLKKILLEYKFPKRRIDYLLEGQNVYQLTLLAGKRPSTRIIFERIGNILSALFLDVNHHIYLDMDKTDKNNSFEYTFFPEDCTDLCDTYKYWDCILLDYFDYDKYKKSLNYKHK